MAEHIVKDKLMCLRTCCVKREISCSIVSALQVFYISLCLVIAGCAKDPTRDHHLPIPSTTEQQVRESEEAKKESREQKAGAGKTAVGAQKTAADSATTAERAERAEGEEGEEGEGAEGEEGEEGEEKKGK